MDVKRAPDAATGSSNASCTPDAAFALAGTGLAPGLVSGLMDVKRAPDPVTGLSNTSCAPDAAFALAGTGLAPG